VYDNKAAGASRSASRSWSRAVMGLAVSGALLLAGATQAHAAGVSHHSPNTGRAFSSLVGHRYEAMSPAAQMRRVQAPKGLRTAVRSALGSSGAATAASAIGAKLLPNDANAQNVFGTSIAVSGNTALVGATTANGGPGKGTGAAYVFVKGPTGRWTQQAKLAATDPAGTAKENFGFSVALDGDTAVIGAPNRGQFPGDPFGGSGAAYVFQRSGTTWSQQAILTETPSGGNLGDFFGFSVAISGGTVLASAVGTAIPGHDTNSGGVFEFVRSGVTWPQVAGFAGADTVPNDTFGWDVALSGGTAVIGAPSARSGPGKAYVFTKTSTGFAQRAELTPPNRAGGDLFGYSVALSGRTILVGQPGCCPLSPRLGVFRGAAFTFVHHDGRWVNTARLMARDGKGFILDSSQEGDFFGDSVALTGGTAVIGASQWSKPPAVAQTGIAIPGAAYEFQRAGDAFTGQWSQTRKVTAADGARLDQLGFSVGIAGTTGLAGAPFHNTDRGAVYLFGL
jgi:FG-GAP repeat protein